MSNDDAIRVRPSKEFFVNLMIRDIGLSDCVLDLIDNSIDCLIRQEDLDVTKFLFSEDADQLENGFYISINISQDSLVITDNCGGISIDEAKKRVFQIGAMQSISTAHSSKPGLSVFGIGLKRAFFKMGKILTVNSCTNDEEIEVVWDLDEWMSKKDRWDINFKYAGKIREKSQDNRGITSISITKLKEGIGKHFMLTTFRNILIKRISSAYTLFLNAGISIRLNDSDIEYDLPPIGTSDSIKPSRKHLKSNDVDVLILTGITEQKDRTPRGWYIFCNGRLILGADQTIHTGWGLYRFPLFAQKYNHFVGYVNFSSSSLHSLPWKTTKDGIDFESDIYQSTLDEMMRMARPYLEFLSNIYVDTELVDDSSDKEIFETAQTVTIDQLPKSDSEFLIQARPTQRGKPEYGSIQYRKKYSEITKVINALGKKSMSNKEVGIKTFEYFISKECD